MTDLYNESYPPSILGGGGGTPPATNVFPSAVTAGTPGAFSNPLSPPATLDIPDDLAELQSLGALGATAAWATGEYVDLEGGSTASWDGSAWIAGAAADEPDDDDPDEVTIPVLPTSIDVDFDPSEWNVDQVQAYIDNIADAGAHEDDPAVIAETQRVLELEIDGANRSTLVTWLDHRYGVVHP